MEEKRAWTRGLTLALCVVLLGVDLWQVRQISDLRGQLGSVETNLQMETRRLDERVQDVQRTVRDAGALVQDWGYAPSVDAAKRCLSVEVWVALKEWGKEDSVEVLWTDQREGGEGSARLLGGGAGRFSGTLELPLAGYREFTLAAVIRSADSQRREDLGYLGGTPGLLPVQCFGWGTGGPNYTRDADKNGTLTVSGCEVNLTGFEGGADLPQLSGQAFRLRRNGETAAEPTAMYGDTIDRYACEELSSEARVGDEFILTFYCRDENGLGYEFFLEGWSIDENGLGDGLAPEADWPKLTWDEG